MTNSIVEDGGCQQNRRQRLKMLLSEFFLLISFIAALISFGFSYTVVAGISIGNDLRAIGGLLHLSGND